MKSMPVAVPTAPLAVLYVLLLAPAEQFEFTFANVIAASINVLVLSVYGMRLAGRARVFV